MGILSKPPVKPEEEMYGILGQMNPQQAWGQALTQMGAGLAGNASQGWGAGIGAGLSGANDALSNAQMQRVKTMGLIADMQNQKARAAGNAYDKYGKAGAIFQGPDNRFYTVQFGGDGTRKVVPMDEGMSPAKGVLHVGDELVSKSTGGMVRDVGPAMREGKREEAMGAGDAEGALKLPKAQSALAEYDVKNKFLMGEAEKGGGEIDKAINQATGWTTGFTGSITKQIPGTPGYDLAKTLVGIQANLGFEALEAMRANSPTGGALGNITEREIEFLQSTWGSLEQAQTKEQFVQRLEQLKEIKRSFAVLKRQAYERDVARFGASAVPNPDAGAPTVPTAAPAARDNGGWTDMGGVKIRVKP